MGSSTNIEWADATVNFWTGCEKVSAGCKNCYMFRDLGRWGKDGKTVTRVKATTIKSILRKLDKPSRIFTCSFSDFFLESADEWRKEAWEVIKSHPQHQWLILTKRPELIADRLPEDWGDGYPNVWLGISAESQREFNARIIQLIVIPSAIHFVSLEPLLGPIQLGNFLPQYGGAPLFVYDDDRMVWPLDWVIVGGESGHASGKYKARPTEREWIGEIVSQCDAHQTPVFVKQYGNVLAKQLGKPGKGDPSADYPQQFPNIL